MDIKVFDDRVEMVYQNMVERRGYRSLNLSREWSFQKRSIWLFQILEIMSFQ